MDTGYVTAHELVASRTVHGVELVGPVMPDTTWQANANAGYAAGGFIPDWDTRTVTCPQGQRSTRWAVDTSRRA